MGFKESETVELKSIVTDDIRKELIAFANSQGGTVFIGVTDDGIVCGVQDVDGAALQISNMIRDTIKPDLSMFVHYETISSNDLNVLSVQVQPGTNRPYYLAKKGLRPEGVYVRQGHSSVPASDEAIRKMIKETDGDIFENMRSVKQNLTFEAVGEEFKSRNMPFSPVQMKTLGIIGSDDLYTNLGLILSDQCLHTVKAAVFDSVEQDTFRNRKEFSGSVFSQMNEVYNFIDFYNENKAYYDKLLRIDKRNYPEIAVREALLNCFVHRDYALSASSIISIYSDRIEFTSIGGLVPEITVKDIMMGISYCRNQKLANIFYRLELIEAYGTGIGKILKAYKDSPVKPKIETSPNVFKLILPNQNFVSKNEQLSRNQKFVDDDPQQQVISYLQKNGSVNRKEIEKLLGISQISSGRLLSRMVASGQLKRYGSARSTRYRLS